MKSTFAKIENLQLVRKTINHNCGDETDTKGPWLMNIKENFVASR